MRESDSEPSAPVDLLRPELPYHKATPYEPMIFTKDDQLEKLWAYSVGAPNTIALYTGTTEILKQDNDSCFGDYHFCKEIGATTLTADTVPETRFIDVVSVASISIGDYLIVSDGAGNNLSTFEVISVVVTTVELDSLIDKVYPAGSIVSSNSRDMNVDGSVTPQVFRIISGGPGSTLNVDVTKMLMICLTDTPVDLSKFGDITGGLTYGCMLRCESSGFKNFWNVKRNSDFAILDYDWSPLSASNPAQGQDGFIWRYSLNGDDKHGVVYRSNVTKILEFVVQDNLLPLNTLRLSAANHEVLQ